MSPDHPAAGKSWIRCIWIQRDHKILSAKLEHEKVFLDSSVLSLEAEGQPVPDLQLEQAGSNPQQAGYLPA